MNIGEQQYLDLLKDILENGVKKPVWGNPGVHIKGVFGRQIRFDMSKGFPLLTTKKVFMRGITHELLWFLRGDSNIKYLIDNDVHIWDEWGYKQYKMKNEKLKMKNGGKEKIGRNDPCPCGAVDPATGKPIKYKRCHGK